MAISLLTDAFRGARRVRLFFTGPLAAGAFTSTAMYTVASADGYGVSPINVEAVFAIASDPNAVELSIDSDFTNGRSYLISCIAVPAITGPAFTGSITDSVGQPIANPPNVEPETNDYDLILYSRDIQWASGFTEDSTGDLLTISGRPNWQGALSRRMISSGLTWNTPYGAKSNQMVDAPSPLAPALAGQLLAQARQDNRTKRASISFSQNPNDVDGWGFLLEATGQDNLNPMTVYVPIPGTSGF